MTSSSAFGAASFGSFPVQPAAGLTGLPVSPAAGFGNVLLTGGSTTAPQAGLIGTALGSDLEAQLLRGLLARLLGTVDRTPTPPAPQPGTDLEAQLVRALLARLAGTLLDRGGTPSDAGHDDVATLNKRLDAEIAQLRKEMEKMAANDKDTAKLLNMATDEITRLGQDVAKLTGAELQKKIDDIDKRLKTIQENKNIKELLSKP
jgi:hypothetical protein